MNLLDRAISYVAPTVALRRAQSREVLAAYRGGISTRMTPGSPLSQSYIGGRSSDRRNLGSERDRARRVYSENAIGRSLLRTEVDNVVAEGFTLQARTDSADFNREVEERWHEWLDKADITGMYTGAELQREAYRCARQDGDGGLLLVDRGGESRLQYVPGDLVANPDKWLPTYRDGVEVNRVGRPQAFHVLSQDEHGQREWTRVTAENFAWLCFPPDPMQVRGRSCYATAFALLDQLDAYVDAVVIAARMAAIFGLIFKSPTAGKQFGNLGTLTNGQGEQQRGVTLENGMVRYIGTEDEVAQVQASQPMAQTPDFVRIVLRLIGVAFDMPLELVLKDVSQANLSSLRGGRQDYHRACRPRRNWYASHWSRIYQWWLSREVKAGTFTSEVPEVYFAHEMHARGWEFTDPVTDVQAKMLECEAGFDSPQNVAATLGRDYETLVKQNEEARKTREAANLPDLRTTLTRDPMAVPAGVPVTLPDQQADAADAPATEGEADAGVTTTLTLNGAQITAAIEVLLKLRSGEIGPDAAVELLVGVGIERTSAERMASESQSLPAPTPEPEQ